MSDLATLVRVSRLYYELGETQEAIAALIGVTRPQVSRLLKEARAQGVVEIRIVDRTEVDVAGRRGAPRALRACGPCTSRRASRARRSHPAPGRAAGGPGAPERDSRRHGRRDRRRRRGLGRRRRAGAERGSTVDATVVPLCGGFWRSGAGAEPFRRIGDALGATVHALHAPGPPRRRGRSRCAVRAPGRPERHRPLGAARRGAVRDRRAGVERGDRRRARRWPRSAAAARSARCSSRRSRSTAGSSPTRCGRGRWRSMRGRSRGVSLAIGVAEGPGQGRADPGRASRRLPQRARDRRPDRRGRARRSPTRRPRERPGHPRDRPRDDAHEGRPHRRPTACRSGSARAEHSIDVDPATGRAEQDPEAWWAGLRSQRRCPGRRSRRAPTRGGAMPAPTRDLRRRPRAVAHRGRCGRAGRSGRRSPGSTPRAVDERARARGGDGAAWLGARRPAGGALAGAPRAGRPRRAPRWYLNSWEALALRLTGPRGDDRRPGRARRARATRSQGTGSGARAWSPGGRGAGTVLGGLLPDAAQPSRAAGRDAGRRRARRRVRELPRRADAGGRRCDRRRRRRRRVRRLRGSADPGRRRVHDARRHSPACTRSAARWPRPAQRSTGSRSEILGGSTLDRRPDRRGGRDRAAAPTASSSCRTSRASGRRIWDPTRAGRLRRA